MATQYANQKLTTAIRDHLLNVDAVPPNAEMSKLASDLARVCLAELKIAGLGSETVEKLFAPSKAKAGASTKRVIRNSDPLARVDRN